MKRGTASGGENTGQEARKKIQYINSIVHAVKKIIDSGNHNVLEEIERFYKPRKSIARLDTKLKPKR